MKLRTAKFIPLFICGSAIAIACALQLASSFVPGFKTVDRLEWMTYDWRMRLAHSSATQVSDKLGFVYIGDDAISVFSEGKLGTNLQFGLYWPRQVYARALRELHAQGATAVAMDVLFGERRPNDPAFQSPKGPVDSDRFFQAQVEQAGPVILGATHEVVPHSLFRHSAAAVGDITIDRDPDGVLRRVKACQNYRIWHPEILLEAKLNGWLLEKTKISTNELVFTSAAGGTSTLALTEDGYFDPTELTPRRKPVGGFVRLQRAFEDTRVWHLGIVLAARGMGLELEKAEVDLSNRQIVFRGTNGINRTLPVDAQGRFLIDWSVRQGDPALTVDAFETLVASDILRQRGTNLAYRFRDKLVIIGSVASGNELSDRGATPLEKDTFLTAQHWNVANSMLTGRFMKQSATGHCLALIGLMGLLSALFTLRLRVIAATVADLLLCLAYLGTAVLLFVQHQHAIPIITPVGVVLATHAFLVSHQAVFEQWEKRRVKNIFARIVSPNVVQELLRAEDLSLVGTRRPITVLFADVRGFTEMTDYVQAQVDERVLAGELSPAEATAYSDARARDMLKTVNGYLGLIADTVKHHEGTLDKYIGDCVMAFWGAPTPNEQHAVSCVNAAIEAQRAIYSFNQERAVENDRRQKENHERIARGEDPLPMLELLSVGTGINTGVVTVGLMGSESHIQNYTVFGREVNLAARLEPVSGRGHILIGEATYNELLRYAPALAGTCLPWEPLRLKGFATAVKVYEVPWRTLPMSVPEEELEQPVRLMAALN